MGCLCGLGQEGRADKSPRSTTRLTSSISANNPISTMLPGIFPGSTLIHLIPDRRGYLWAIQLLLMLSYLFQIKAQKTRDMETVRRGKLLYVMLVLQSCGT